MRALSIVLCLTWLAIPAHAIARPAKPQKPKIAVAPLDGDPGNKVALAVVEALSGKDYAVIGPKETGREMTKLGIDSLDGNGKATRKLAQKLGAVAIIDGKVSKDGRKRSLHLEVHRRGKADDGFTVEFKSATTTGFRRGIHDEIGKKLDGASDDPSEDDEARKVAEDNERNDRKRKADEDSARQQREADEDSARKRKAADDDDTARKRKAQAAADDDAAARRSRKPDDRKRRTAAADRSGSGSGDGDAGDDDTATVRRRKARARDDAAPALVAARVGAGGSVAQRQLSWDLRSGFTQIPPRVLTTAGAGRIDAEVYPLALSDPSSSLAGLGLAASYDKTFGLSIKVPNQTVSAPIDQSHYAIGARYRIGVGEASSVAFGLDYAHRDYIAERGGLMGAVLDAPDVAYSAVAPGASLRVPVTPSVAVFGGADGLLIFEAGAIQKSASYGPATVYGVEASAGVDIAIAKQVGLRVALEYSQIMFKFTPQGSTLANNRDGDPTTQDVMGATDRSIGGVVTLGLVY